MSNPMVDVPEGEHAGAFGEGGETPYERALTANAGGSLRLRAADDITGGRASVIDVERFRASADAVDLAVLQRGQGSVLDLGCGPGRMVRAAIDAGRRALGVDLSDSAISIARAAGLPVMQASVFDTLPHEGRWGQVLLLDGNLGIGGDVEALLRRAAALVDASGTIVVEAHRRRTHRREFDAVLVDDAGCASDVFPWAEMGSDAVVVTAHAAGLRVRERWTQAGRAFVELATRPRRLRRA